jgi:hypothetical protein
MPDANHPGGLAGAVITIIETVRDWRQLAILLILAFCGLMGTLIYQERDRIVASLDTFMTTPAPVRLADASHLQSLTDTLYNQLTPDDAVVIWKIDMIHNRRTLVAMKFSPAMAAALPHIQIGRVTPLFSRASPEANLLTIKVLDGEVPCGIPPRTILDSSDPTAPTPDIPDLISEVCCVGIPPTTDAFVGMIAVGFQKPLAKAREGVVTATLRTMAEQGIK